MDAVKACKAAEQEFIDAVGPEYSITDRKIIVARIMFQHAIIKREYNKKEQKALVKYSQKNEVSEEHQGKKYRVLVTEKEDEYSIAHLFKNDEDSSEDEESWTDLIYQPSTYVSDSEESVKSWKSEDMECRELSSFGVDVLPLTSPFRYLPKDCEERFMEYLPEYVKEYKAEIMTPAQITAMKKIYRRTIMTSLKTESDRIDNFKALELALGDNVSIHEWICVLGRQWMKDQARDEEWNRRVNSRLAIVMAVFPQHHHCFVKEEVEFSGNLLLHDTPEVRDPPVYKAETAEEKEERLKYENQFAVLLL